MQQIGVAWQKLPRIVRDLSSELGKPIELEMHGAETELDRQVLELIKDPLTHMIRNSADHGLEMPAERRACGKPEKGTIRLSARHEGGRIVIEVADDGAGLNLERIKATAVARGLATQPQIDRMSVAQIQRFIFAPGFTTAQRVTSVSGRGIGMDVVRANIEDIGGTVDVKSVPGKGTRFSLKIPLTLAIVSALIVEAAGDRFASPQLAVVELVRARNNSEHRIERIKDAAVLRLRDKLLPLVHLKVLLKIDEGADCQVENGFILVTQIGSQMFGIVVDAVFHTEEIVVKPMSSKLRHIPVFAGNTILGDGSVIMIIEPNGIAHSIGNVVIARDAAAATQDGDRSDDGSGIESMLVFRAGSPQPRAVLLSLVTRLEEIDVRKIESANGRALVQYRGQLMPLIPVNDAVRIKSAGKQPLLVFSDEGRSMALMVDEIVDIVEQKLDIELASQQPGVLGSALLRGHATEVIDIGHFLPLARLAGLAVAAGRHRPASRAAGGRFPVLPQHALTLAECGRVRRHQRGVGRGGAGGVARGRAGRRAHHRCRHAGYGWLRAGIGAAPRSAHRGGTDHRVVVAGVGRGGRARTPGRPARLRGQVRSPGSHRGAQGADRRHEPGGVRNMVG
jgi:two-component system chemotaxis sensor kinase CheA